MRSSLESQIRQKLGQYLAGLITLREFEEWFSPATWDVENSGEPAAATLTWEIELRLAEYSNGHRTDGELRELLQKAVEARTARPPSHRAG